MPLADGWRSVRVDCGLRMGLRRKTEFAMVGSSIELEIPKL